MNIILKMLGTWYNANIKQYYLKSSLDMYWIISIIYRIKQNEKSI